jgi:hypothetical protein
LGPKLGTGRRRMTGSMRWDTLMFRQGSPCPVRSASVRLRWRPADAPAMADLAGGHPVRVALPGHAPRSRARPGASFVSLAASRPCVPSLVGIAAPLLLVRQPPPFYGPGAASYVLLDPVDQLDQPGTEMDGRMLGGGRRMAVVSAVSYGWCIDMSMLAWTASWPFRQRRRRSWQCRHGELSGRRRSTGTCGSGGPSASFDFAPSLRMPIPTARSGCRLAHPETRSRTGAPNDGG